MNSSTVVMYDTAGTQRITVTPSVDGQPFESVTTATATVYSPSGTALATPTVSEIAATDTTDLQVYIEDAFAAATYPVDRDYYILFEITGALSDTGEDTVKTMRVGFDVMNLAIQCGVTPKEVRALDPDLRRVTTLNTDAKVRPFIMAAYEESKQRLRSVDRYDDLLVDINVWNYYLRYAALVRIYRYLGKPEKLNVALDAAESYWNSLTSNYREVSETDPSDVSTDIISGRRTR